MTVFVFALITAVCTGLRALPFAMRWSLTKKSLAISQAIAAALMIAASFGLIYQGINYQASAGYTEGFQEIGNETRGVVMGILIGLVFIVLADRWMSKYDDLQVYQLRWADAKKALLIVGIMTVHSFTEGVAVGVSFWPSEAFGIFIALAIAVHNIPEGLAISAVLVPRGISRKKAAWWSIFSSLPQPLMAVPAFVFVNRFAPFLPMGLGFAAGAMLWMSFAELLPDALEGASRSRVAAIATIMIMLMIVFQQLIG